MQRFKNMLVVRDKARTHERALHQAKANAAKGSLVDTLDSSLDAQKPPGIVALVASTL